MVPQRRISRFMIRKVRDDRSSRRRDTLAVEEPMEIRLNLRGPTGERREHSLSVTMRTPGDDFELAVGFLYTEGVIESSDDVEEVTYCMGTEKAEQAYNVVSVKLRAGINFDPELLQRNFYTTSSCGVCGKTSLEAIETQRCPILPKGHPMMSMQTVHSLNDQLRNDQSVFQATGGIHAAGLFNAEGELISLREDVGRHNAVDKVIGEKLLAGELPLNDYLMMVSGRSSFEIMQKALVAGIPMVAAVGAPSSLAVDLAREFGMTLLGFVRDGRYNVYAGGARIASDVRTDVNVGESIASD
ncbi:MAG: formate dehydrogenase accessory sulfurtransferase FdhD [Candidatus Bipolaricaulia bacterium]